MKFRLTDSNEGFPYVVLRNGLICSAKLYIPSTPNNSNATHTFMCLGRAGRFGHTKTALKFKHEI